MIAFLAGLFIGSTLGIFVAALCAVSKRSDPDIIPIHRRRA